MIRRQCTIIAVMLMLLTGCGTQAYSGGSSPFGYPDGEEAVFGDSGKEPDGGGVFGYSSDSEEESTSEEVTEAETIPATAAVPESQGETVSYQQSPGTEGNDCTIHREMLSGSEKQNYDKLYRSFSSGSVSAMLSPGIEWEEILKVYRSVLSDHPEYFWVASQCTYNSSGSVSFSTLVTVNESNHEEYEQRLEQGIQDVLSQVPEGLSLYDKILCIHDIIVNSTVYGTDYVTASAEDSERYYTAYGCLVDHRAVCEGYSKGFMAVMNRIGVPCGVVSGKDKRNGQGHAWNYVEYEGKYYWIDVTWDDPLMVTEDDETGKDGTLSHKYYFIDDEELYRTHEADTDDTQFIPVCSSSDLTYYKATGQYMDSYSFEAVDQLITKYSGKVKLQFGSQEAYDAAVGDLIYNNAIFETSYAKRSGADYCQRIMDNESLTLEFIF